MIDVDTNDEDGQVEECSVCGGDIIVDEYCEEDDVVYCNDCEAEFVIRSLDPIRLKLLNDDIDEDSDFDGDYD